MEKYTEQDLLILAKRFHNTKRTYLLVDPLQGKHMPVHPSKALKMFKALGQMVKNDYPETKLVIGFAETATAIGMAVAKEISDDCVYIHTTREGNLAEDNFIEFLEEHSHATEQKLAASNLKKWFENTDTIVFVDDEISTGKTIINFVKQLKEKYPEIENKKLIAASVINRVTDENNIKMQKNGIDSISLLKLKDTDFTEAVSKFDIEGALEVSEDSTAIEYEKYEADNKLLDPRLGVNTAKYQRNCELYAKEFMEKVTLPKNLKKVLVLGTEECMYPAITLGHMLESSIDGDVYTHSSTRSPIGICTEDGYPIVSGYKIGSFYDNERSTYIYNLDSYDLVIIATDSKYNEFDIRKGLIGALIKEGNERIVLYRG